MGSNASQVKLLMMNFISRVVGAHRLLLLSFYSHLQRYIASQQREVTHILAYLVQACHDLVPPDEVSKSFPRFIYTLNSGYRQIKNDYTREELAFKSCVV